MNIFPPEMQQNYKYHKLRMLKIALEAVGRCYFWTSVASLTRRPFSDLKRFSDSNNRASKLSTFVNFPLKELDLREFASESSGECRPREGEQTAAGGERSPGPMTDPCLSLPAERAVYNLYAVSNHSGNALGGHYTAYCRNPALGEWYSYNDTRYHQITSHFYQFHYTVCAPVIKPLTSFWLYKGVSACVLHWLREGV